MLIAVYSRNSMNTVAYAKKKKKVSIGIIALKWTNISCFYTILLCLRKQKLYQVISELVSIRTISYWLPDSKKKAFYMMILHRNVLPLKLWKIKDKLISYSYILTWRNFILFTLNKILKSLCNSDYEKCKLIKLTNLLTFLFKFT